ncbi:MAG: c-type cytochrome [Pseudomonadota bacterium]
MHILYPVVLASGIFAAPAFALDGRALMEQNNCATCHAIEAQSAGPSFKDIAAKYRGDKNAMAVLERKMRYGGGGVWGKMPMPATANSVSDNELKSILQWILSLK